MPSLIVADLGGVVIRIDPERSHRCWAELSPLSPAEVAGRLFPDEVYEAFERGQVSGPHYLAHVRDQLRSGADDAALAACFNDIYLGIDADVLDTLAARRAAGSRLVALTNTNQLHHDHWWPRYREPLGVFDHVYLSFELGARKPEPACFQAVLDAERVAPGDAVFIDDLPENVDAARAVGLAGIHHTSAAQLSNALEQLIT